MSVVSVLLSFAEVSSPAVSLCSRLYMFLFRELPNQHARLRKIMQKQSLRSWTTSIPEQKNFGLYIHTVQSIWLNNKKLCYCKWTARRAMLVNSCYFFHKVWELERFQTAKVTYIRSFNGIDNGAIQQVTYDLLLVTCSVATMSLSCTVGEILLLVS